MSDWLVGCVRFYDAKSHQEYAAPKQRITHINDDYNTYEMTSIYMIIK